MAKFTWIDKEPSTNFRNKVKGIDLTLEYSDGDKSIQTSCSTAFGADDIKPASEWTEEKIDEYAESMRSQLGWDAQLKEDIKKV
mgnify:CR=1 FL=1|jgi:hypothetical protein